MARLTLPLFAVVSFIAAGSGAQVAPASVEVIGIVRAVEAGSIISAEDLGVVETTPTMARLVLINPEQVLGKEAKRLLPAGKPVRSYDVMEPLLVRKGQKVSIVVEKSGMTIAATGKAMTAGAAGTVVRVQNSHSYALLEGEVAGPGLVKVSLGGR